MRYLVFIYGLLFLVSCASIPDVPVCVDLGTPETPKGWCTYTIANNEFFVDDDKNLFNEKKWSDVKRHSLIMPADSWKEIKRYILNNCKKHSDCFDEVGKWQRKTSSIDENLEKKK